MPHFSLLQLLLEKAKKNCVSKNASIFSLLHQHWYCKNTLELRSFWKVLKPSYEHATHKHESIAKTSYSRIMPQKFIILLSFHNKKKIRNNIHMLHNIFHNILSLYHKIHNTFVKFRNNSSSTHNQNALWKC